MIYDLAIIGSGPAGITAAIYASRNNLKTILLTESFGGVLSSKPVSIENYPGFINISGTELTDKFLEQLNAQTNVSLIEKKVLEVERDNNNFFIKTEDENFSSKAIIVALGSVPRKLNIKGEEEFLGRGVGYCAVCDGPFFKNKIVAIIGGGNAGFESAIFLSGIASKIYIIERNKNVLAEEINQQKAKTIDSIEIITGAAIKEIRGGERVSSLVFEKDGQSQEIFLDGVFINAGYSYDAECVKKLVQLNAKGEIIVDKDNGTGVDGLFAAGDITDSKIKQIVCATCSGAIAALSAYNYLKGKYEQD